MSLRETILATVDVGEEIVTVPQWGDVKILVRGLTAGQRFTVYHNPDGTMKDWSRTSSELVAACSFDPDTKERIFTPEDVDLLLKKNSFAVEKLSDAIFKLSKMDDKAFEEAVKNSGTVNPKESASSKSRKR
jgi:hypothetical protein